MRKYSKHHDDITKADVYVLHGLANTIDLKARIFAERKTEWGQSLRRYYPQIDDDCLEAVICVGDRDKGFRYLKEAKIELEQALAFHLEHDGAWAVPFMTG